MSQFRFRLQTVLDIKRRREDQLAAELAELLARLLRERQLLDNMRRQRDAAGEEMARRNGRLDLDQVRSQERYRERLEDAINQQVEAMQLIQEQIDACRARLVTASQERQALDNLYERQKNAHRQEEARLEQAFLDEIATNRVARVMVAG